MAVTVNYKGSSIAAFENITKTLNTAGTYLEGDITIQDNNFTNAFIMRAYSGNYENSNVTVIGSGAFMANQGLYSVNFPNVVSTYNSAFQQCFSLKTYIGPSTRAIYTYAFNSCSSLTTIQAFGTYIGAQAFFNCIKLPIVNFQSTSRILSSAFRNCYSLSTAIFGYSAIQNAASIAASAFYSCYNLLSLYLLNSTVYTLENTSVFGQSPISTRTTSTGGVQGSIFVPSSLYNTYISATNWATYSERFVGLTDEEIQRVIETGTHIAT